MNSIASINSCLTIEDVLHRFGCNNLQDLKQSALMNRVDTKFVIPRIMLEGILDSLSQHYNVLEIEGQRYFRYESTYFDTRDFHFYNSHHRGKLNRHKVRLRRYVDTGSQFLEVKFKNNKKRTIKKRTEIADARNFDIRSHKEYLQKNKVPFADQLHPTLMTSYNRITLADENRGERLTIDFDLKNQSLVRGKRLRNIGEVAIFELKQSRIDRRSPFFELIKSRGIRSGNFSKYCMGMTYTQEQDTIKSNRFKRVVHHLNRICSKPEVEMLLC